MALRPKHQRLVLAALALAALLGAVLLAMWGLRDRAAYFATPSDIAAGHYQPGKAMRLGGMVVRGSLRHAPDGVTIRFTVSDLKRTIPVRFTGITPSLFREGRLNHLELSKVLGLDRFETDAVLQRHEVVNGGLTLNDLEMDRVTLDRILGPANK